MMMRALHLLLLLLLLLLLERQQRKALGCRDAYPQRAHAEALKRMIADSVPMLASAAQHGRDVTRAGDDKVWVHMHVAGGKLCDRKSVTAKTDEQAQLASHLPRVLCTNCARIYCEVTSGNILQTNDSNAI
jgi:hypothetical protein